MIIKENSNPAPTEKFEKAGYDAERKVAYYLKMAFGDEPRLLILHDVRLEFEDGITAQMDHLLIHQYGLIIIESKSVAGKLQVKGDGQWLRWYNNNSKGMQNPIKQAQLQGQTLKRVLLNSSKENTRKVLENFPIDVLVSISDSGEFIAHNRALYPEVCKADQVDDRIKAIVLNRAKNAKADDFVLSDVNKSKLAEHLIKNHKPYQAINDDIFTKDSWKVGQTVSSPKFGIGIIVSLEGDGSNRTVRIDFEKGGLKLLALEYAQLTHYIQQVNSQPTAKNEVTKINLSSKAKQETSTYNPFSKQKSDVGILGKIANAFAEPDIKFEHKCTYCKSNKIEIKYGRNYYFQCLNCNKNYPIAVNCYQCNQALKIRKEKKHFFANCLSCNCSELFHINH